jgi:hypothetical protein
MLNSLLTRSLDALEEIVLGVQIQSNLSISHPNYKPLEFPAEILERFQQLPLEIQNKYLSLQLRNFLYSIYFSGEQKPVSQSDINASNQNIENNTSSGLNLEFYERLQASNSGEGYFDPNWRAIKQKSDRLVVNKQGINLHIDRHRHLHLAELDAIAEIPDSPETVKTTFGKHRCQIIADGLLEAWQKGDNSTEARMKSIRHHFSRFGIDWQRPYLNLNSDDIYTPFVG